MNPIEYSRMHQVEDRHWWYVGLHELVLATIGREARRLGRPLSILDAGCGTGRLCQLMIRQGHRVTGCDVSDEALRLCRVRQLPLIFQADLNTVELEPGAFDVITSIDVLYHRGIADDVAVLRRLRSGLRPGGLLILNLVAHEFLRSRHDLAVHTRERYTRRLLHSRLTEAGFHIGRLSYRVMLPFPAIALYRLTTRHLCRHQPPETQPSDVSQPHPLANRVLLATVRAENLALEKIRLPFGSSLFAVARAPQQSALGQVE